MSTANIYVPSMMAHFTLKFDESLQLQPDQQAVSVDTLTKTGSKAGANNATKPLIVSQGRESFVLNRVPLECTVDLPGYRQAGSFSLKMDFGEMPIDPRTVRAAAVELHLGTISHERFAKGISRPPKIGSDSVLDTRGNGFGDLDTQVLTAMIDKWRVSHTNDGSMIEMSGRDLRGILLDTPVATDPQESTQMMDQLRLDQPIDELVAQILSYHPFYYQAKFIVGIHPSEWGREGVPRPGDRKVIPRVKKGAKGTKTQPHFVSDVTKLSFWDLIVQFCYLVGAIPVVRGTDIIIRPVRRLYDQQNAGIDPTVQTPFLGGAVRTVDAESGKPISPLRVRRMVYGRDLEKLEIERNFAGYARPRVVRCVAHDPSSPERGTDKVLVAWWPPLPDKVARKTSASPGQEKPREEIIDIPVAGIRDPERLKQIAHAIYDEMGRGEIGGSIETRKLSSFGGDNSDPDLLRLRPGDAVELAVDTRTLRPLSPLVSEYTDHLRKPFSQRVQEIASILGDQNLAQVIVATSRGQIQELQRFFRCSGVKYSWSAGGLSVSFDFQNYVEVRYKADDDQPPQSSPLKRTTV